MNQLFVSFLAFSLQVCAIGILCVFVRDSGSFLCVVQVIIYSARFGLKDSVENAENLVAWG